MQTRCFLLAFALACSPVWGDETYPLRSTFLPNSATSTEDHFGFAVALSERYLIVGSPYDDTAANNAGAAYIFDLSTSAPQVAVHTLYHPNQTAHGFFGSSVAISGNYLVIGAPDIDAYSDLNAGGKVFVYDLAGATPTVPIAVLTNPNANGPDRFGTSVAIANNLVVVGADRDHQGAGDAGSAFVFDLHNSNPAAPVATLVNPSPAAYDQFGWTVTQSGNLAVVSAPGEALVCLYDLAGATPATPIRAYYRPALIGSIFGWSIALNESFLIVGSFQPYANYTATQAVYVYNLNDDPSSAPLSLALPSIEHAASVAIQGTKVVVGKQPQAYLQPRPFAMTSLTNASDSDNPVAVYDLSSSTPTIPITGLYNPTSNSDDYFGAHVAISSGRIVVGAPLNDIANSNAGAVYLFGEQIGPPIPLLQLLEPGGASLTNGGNYSFGNLPLNQTSSATFSIRNVGAAELTDINLAIDGTDNSSFAIISSPALTVLPGESTTFTISFNAATVGFKGAVFHLTSNDSAANPFDLFLAGRALTELEAWRQTYFGTPDSSGSGADGADPDGDGDENIAEFIVGIDPTDANSRFLYRVDPVANEPAQKAIIFSPIAPGRSYVVKASTDLSSASSLPLTNFTYSDNGSERTVIDLSADGPTKFYSIEVTKP